MKALLGLWKLVSEPANKLRGYRRGYLRLDLVAGLTGAVFAVPQAIAYAAIAGVPAAYGLLSAAVGSLVGGLWGSSRYLVTGPTNTHSILTASVLATVAAAQGDSYPVAAAVLAVLTGLFCLVFALVRLGALANFASRSVLLGFTFGAGLLIILGQLRHLLGIGRPAVDEPFAQLGHLATHLGETDLVTALFGLGTLVVAVVLQRLHRRLPAALGALVLAGAVVALVGPERLGLAVVGDLVSELAWPDFTTLDALFDRDIGRPLIGGGLAVAALSAVTAVTTAREVSRQRGDRVEVNQELFGQGAANIASGLAGGFVCSGSFTRTALNLQAGARTQVASAVAGAGIFAITLAFGALGRFLPQASVAGVVVAAALGLVDWRAMRRLFRASRTESAILLATLAATLLVPLDLAVLIGVLISLAVFVYQSSLPRVVSVVPDPTFRHLEPRGDRPECPQLALVRLYGSLYFGATSHVEDELLAILERNPGQTTMVLHMSGVNRCDYSGIELLEGMTRYLRDRDGDLYLVNANAAVREIMARFGFVDLLGADHFPEAGEAIRMLFEERLDPAVCCYECEHHVFAECQAVPAHCQRAGLPAFRPDQSDRVVHLSAEDFALAVAQADAGRLFVDVRERSEYEAGHLAGAELVPLPEVLTRALGWDKQAPVFLVCRSGRRSTRAGIWLLDNGFARVHNLHGGVLSWRAKGMPLEVA